MVSYLKYEREARRQNIKDWYDKVKDEIPEELKQAPLREFTYGMKRELGAGSRFWTKYLNDFIHKYKVRLDKDVTLEDAVNSI